MLKRISLSLAVLLCSASLWCQVEPSATGGSEPTSDDSLMTLPPPVSGTFYPSSAGSQERSNTLSGGVIGTVAYDDNVLAGETSKPISAETYTIFPNIRLDERTARARASLSYSPGFTFYDPTTDLNQFNQNATADFQYRLTSRMTFGLQEVFQQNSTIFSQPYTLAGATVSGSADSASPIVVLPYAGQLMDSTQAHLSYQFSRSSMIGGAGSFSSFHFSNLTQNIGLYNSDGGGGSAFYNRRLTRSQYIGINYRYSISESNPVPSTTQSQYATVFYTMYLARTLSLSITGGPEYATSSAPGVTPIHTWAPSGVASIGWQKSRANFALTYSRAITTGWGLLGSFTADNANASVQMQFTRRLLGGLSGNYANTKNATPSIVSSTQLGHLIFGRASLQYLIGEHLTAVAEYTRLHESYSGISAISNNPNADRVAVSLNYRFSRPLGK
jgi:hypothetical protein